MKSNSTTLIAVLVVAVIAIAAVGGYIILNDGPQDRDVIEYTQFPIMGNANNDNIIDQKDIDLIQEIIDGEKIHSDYPYADANYDGMINQNDIDVTRKLINGEDTTVYVIDQNNEAVKLNYPLKNVVTINVDMLSLVLQIGGQDKIAAYVSSSYPVSQRAADYAGAEDLGFGRGRSLDADNYVKLKNLDVKLVDDNGIGAILAMTNAAVSDHIEDLNNADIPVLRINCSAPIDSIDASLTIGFLLGPEIELKARAYYDASYDILNMINEKLESLADNEKVKVLSLTMMKYITEKESAYTLVTQLAGGNNITDIDGDSSTALNSADAIAQKQYNDVEYLLSFSTKDYAKINIREIWEHKSNDFLKASSAYDNLIFINAIMPVPCRVAYVAEILYPELFESGFGDNTLQSFVDNFMPYLNENQADGIFDVTTDMTTIVTKAMYEAL